MSNISKEEALKALRESNILSNKSNNKGSVRVDDIMVVKYLDANRRKATTIEEVEVIDAIMKALFHEGMNKITGRVHGERVQETAGSNSPDAVTLGDLPAGTEGKFDKRAYQRDLMRKRRAK